MMLDDMLDEVLPGNSAEAGAGRPTAGTAHLKMAGQDRLAATIGELALRSTGDPWGVRELAEAITLDRSTVNRFLQNLVGLQLAQRDSHGNYRIGPRMRVLSNALHQRHPLLSAARNVIADVATQVEGTVILVLHDAPHSRGFVVLRTATTGPIRYRLDPGVTMPLHAGAAGRSLLSRLGSQVLNTSLEKFTANTITDHAVLDQLITQDRSLGYSISVAEHFDLAAGAAAPFEFAGLLGAVAVIKADFDVTNQDLHRTGLVLRQAADELTRLAGTRGAEATSRKDEVERPTDAENEVDPGSLVTRFERLVTALTTNPGGVSATRRSLSARLSANPATAAKLMRNAVDSGLAIKTADRLCAGPTLLRWAAALGVTEQTGALVYAILHELAVQTGETIGLAELDVQNHTAVMATVIPGTRPVNYVFPSGIPIPLAAGAAGKAILAHLPRHVLDEQNLEPHTSRTTLNIDDIARDLDTIRNRGWAVGEGERIPEAYGVAAPFFIDNTIAGSVTITVPRTRVGELDQRILADLVVGAAGEITGLLSLGR